ncbi:MAG: non-homologous end-joining DNA ligase [Gammaproteobacteria bacterium]
MPALAELKTYRRKRDSSKTAEPAGQVARRVPRGGGLFVVHKHAARQLHYDLRLEHDGVLESWAVPKGPSRKPGEKRLAVQVEDHPLDYGGFEGVIPAGEYGGGTVMLWDRGHWREIKRRAGHIDFELEGQKLRGAWTLTRMGGKRSAGKDWLLIKRSDPPGDAGAPAMAPVADARSVASGRTLKEIARDGEDADPTAAELDIAALSHARDAAAVAGVALSHPGRVLYPAQGITKQALAAYFERIADWILPHVRGRPLALLRCPQGRAKECFYQKHPGAALADAVPRARLREKRGSGEYLYVETLTHLVALVQAGTLELHAWGSRVDDLEHPDTLVFDLDPGEDVDWPVVVHTARSLRERLADLGLASFVRTTGGKGLHVVVPVTPSLGWDDVGTFARGVAAAHAADYPTHLTINMSRARRRGRVFIDYLRNSRGATAIVAYSPRARPGAPVAVPLRWDELGPHMRSDHYDVIKVRRRLAALGSDPWADFRTAARPLTRRLLDAVPRRCKRRQ